MTGALALVSAVLALGPLPERGFALETKAGVQLQTLSGRPVGTLPGLDLALDQAAPHAVVLRNPRGRLYAFDGHTLRPRRRRASVRVAAPRPKGVGHWVWGERSPTGNALLAQWSAECEVPVAYLVIRGKLDAFGDETLALGWLPTGEAVVHFRPLGCAGSGRSGIYAAVSTRKMRLLLRTPRFAQYLMWGG
jgi:hypothetical protein